MFVSFLNYIKKERIYHFLFVDCEQSLFFFRFSAGSARERERERRTAKPREARNEGGSPL